MPARISLCGDMKRLYLATPQVSKIYGGTALLASHRSRCRYVAQISTTRCEFERTRLKSPGDCSELPSFENITNTGSFSSWKNAKAKFVDTMFTTSPATVGSWPDFSTESNRFWSEPMSNGNLTDMHDLASFEARTSYEPYKPHCWHQYQLAVQRLLRPWVDVEWYDGGHRQSARHFGSSTSHLTAFSILKQSHLYRDDVVGITEVMEADVIDLSDGTLEDLIGELGDLGDVKRIEKLMECATTRDELKRLWACLKRVTTLADAYRVRYVVWTTAAVTRYLRFSDTSDAQGKGALGMEMSAAYLEGPAAQENFRAMVSFSMLAIKEGPNSLKGPSKFTPPATLFSTTALDQRPRMDIDFHKYTVSFGGFGFPSISFCGTHGEVLYFKIDGRRMALKVPLYYCDDEMDQKCRLHLQNELDFYCHLYGRDVPIPEFIGSGTFRDYDKVFATAWATGWPLTKYRRSARKAIVFAQLMKAVMTAYCKLHAAGVTHGSIKCEHIIVNTRDKANISVTLLDFGRATLYATAEETAAEMDAVKSMICTIGIKGWSP